MLRKLTLCLLVVGLGVQMYPDVSARERDKDPVKSSVVQGSFVRAAIKDITNWIVAPNEWRIQQLSASIEESAPTTNLVEELPVFTPKPRFAYSDLVLSTSDKYGMDWRLVASLISAESSFNPNAVSPKGAKGLMQVMPSTARLYRVQNHELFDPGRNIEAGVQHLKWLANRYPGELDKVVAAYNSGESAVDKYRGIPPFKSTRMFVRCVLSRYQNHLTKFPIPAATTINDTSGSGLRLGAAN